MNTDQTPFCFPPAFVGARPAARLKALLCVAVAVCLAANATASAESPATAPARTVDAGVKKPPLKPQPTRTLVDLPGFTPTPMPDRTAFGGVTGYPAARATGFFRTERIDGRWWLIDPTGHRLLNAAVAATRVNEMSAETRTAFDKAFGSPVAWADRTRTLLRDNGFDGTGCWSDDDGLRAGADRRPVYTHIQSFMGTYGAQRGGTHPEAGHQGYPDKCIFAFDPEFAAYADKFAAGLAAFKDDPYLLGYFTDNELPFPLDALDKYLQLPDADAGRKAAEAFVVEHKIARDKLTDADRQAWTGVLAERYFRTVHDAIRKYDPNHLILGPRFHATDHRNEALCRTAGEYVDVIGYNMYGSWSPGETVTRVSRWAGRPVLISEFYAKAQDSGLANTDGGGWLVKTQADRAAFYEHFVLGLLESRVAVGWHWFKYADNDPAFVKGPNPNDSNKGIVDRFYRPYGTLLDAMRKTNASRYALADYFDRRKTKE